LLLLLLLSSSTPNKPDWSKPWEILVGDGTMDFVMIEPTDIVAAKLGSDSSGTFYWETNHDTAAKNAFQFYVRC
jgi:hypothetical protein